MGLRKLQISAIVAGAVLSVPTFAFADDVISSCTDDAAINDSVNALANAVNDASVASAGFSKASRTLAGRSVANYGTPSFVGKGDANHPTNVVFDIKDAHESDGKSGIVPTVAWSQSDQAEVTGAEGGLPPCLVNLANIRQQYRVQPGLKSSVSGILGAAYAYNNQGPANTRGGELFLTDLMFDKQVYKSLTADQQMQAALGWRSCFPPAGDPNADGNVVARVKAMPPEIQAITRNRILFHEFVHGVTHQQEGNDYANAASTEGFFARPSPQCPQCGASRFDALRAKLFAPGATTPESQQVQSIQQQMAAIQSSDPNARAKYCDLYGQLSDVMKNAGVPERWPGDMHALDDKDEYITILIENAVFNPSMTFGPNSPYSAAEQSWVKQWWTSTFGGSQLGSCSNSAIANGQNPNEKPTTANGYSSDVANALSVYGGF